jgi:hypothetical protein
MPFLEKALPNTVINMAVNNLKQKISNNIWCFCFKCFKFASLCFKNEATIIQQHRPKGRSINHLMQERLFKPLLP